MISQKPAAQPTPHAQFNLIVLLLLGLSFSVTSFNTAGTDAQQCSIHTTSADTTHKNAALTQHHDMAPGKCYFTPCIEDGMYMMYKVHNGMSFLVSHVGSSPYCSCQFLRIICYPQHNKVVLSGFIFIAQPVYGLWFTVSALTALMNGRAIRLASHYIVEPPYCHSQRNQCSELVAGGYMGATLITTIIALINAVFWSCMATVSACFSQFAKNQVLTCVCDHTIM